MDYYQYKKLVEEIFQTQNLLDAKQIRIDNFNSNQKKYLHDSPEVTINRINRYKDWFLENNFEEKYLGNLLTTQPNIIFLTLPHTKAKIETICDHYNQKGKILDYNSFLKSIMYTAPSLLSNSSFEIISIIEELYKTLSNHERISYFGDKKYKLIIISKKDFLQYLNHNAHILISPLTYKNKHKFICYILESTYPKSKNNQVLHLENCQTQNIYLSDKFQKYKCPFEKKIEETFNNIKIEQTWDNKGNILKTLVSKIKKFQH